MVLRTPTSRQAEGLGGGVDPARCVCIVVGASVRAELEDRAAAYSLQAAAERELSRRLGPAMGGWRVVVLTDVWYLNHEDLRPCPTIAVGGPGNCALSAAWIGALPEAMSIEDVLAVHARPDFSEPAAVCWGVDGPATRSAAELFAERYLERFAGAALAG